MARDETVGISVTRTEHQLIREVAEREGFASVSRYLRELLLPEVVERAQKLADEDEKEAAA